MRIHDLNLSDSAHGRRAEATVTWEDCGEPEKKIFIETPADFASDLEASPNAFLVGCLIPALHFGEKRICVEGPVCPGLLEGLETAMALMRAWSGGAYQPPAIEPGAVSPRPGRPPRNRAGMCYSGGIDSLAALQRNMRNFPESHPGRIRDAFFIHGFDIGGVVSRGMKYHVFDRALAAMHAVAAAAGVTAVPVYTNIRHLCDDRELWLNRFFGAVLAAVAHGFAPRIDLFYIASSYDLENLGPCGSHPLLDPEYASFELRIRHRDAALSRLEKLRVVSEWDPGFQNFRVCLANVPERLNCGRCEKCVRTMTGLLAIDALHKTRAFVEDDVTPELFEGFQITIRHREPFYRELLPLLEERGRRDLVETIRAKLAEPPETK
jgi:hypothetical protein